MQKNDSAALCEGQFRRMAEAAPMMIRASGPDRLATYFNRSWLAFRGRRLEEELGYGWTEGLHPEDRERILAAYTATTVAGGDCTLEYRLQRADGEYRWITCSGAPWWSDETTLAGYLACGVDTTDLKRAREQTFDEQKMESMRVLSGGIAHDLCNLLSVIEAQAEEIAAEFAGGTSPAAALCRLRGVATCASEIVRELMIYSEEDQATLERVDVSRLIEGMLALLNASISKRATLRCDLDRDLPAVLGSKTQIRQVILNLAVNASEAIAAREGIIRIGTSKMTTTAAAAGGDPTAADGEYVRIEVTDTGGGMSDETRNRIFERSFTTKVGARGMGLAVVRGIVLAHGGHVKVTGALGQGTTFEVLLPSAAHVAGRGLRTFPMTMLSTASAGAPIVLLIEKEDHLRATIAKALGRTGLSVLSAPDDQAAVDVLRQHSPDIDAVILDLTPGRSGLEVLKEVRLVRESVPIVLTGSGTQVENHQGGPGLSFLPKPYRIERLVKQLRRAMMPRSNRGDAAPEMGIGQAKEPGVNSATIARLAASSLTES